MLFIYFFIVAYLLSPGVLMPIPRKYKLRHVAAVHSAILAIILVGTMKPAMRMLNKNF